VPAEESIESIQGRKKKMTTIRPVAPGLLMLALACSAHGADGAVYRCGQTYQQRLCEGGQPLDASDERTAEQRRDAQAAAAAERRQARELVAERRERERQTPVQAQPMVTGARPAEPVASAPPVKTTRKPKRKKPSAPEEPRYAAPASAKKPG
jgi:hypothetical protein